MLKSSAHPSGLDVFMDHTGVDRVLGRLLPDPDKVKKSARLQDLGINLIPRSAWQPINRRTTMGPQFILNQQQCSGCVGYSSAEAEMRQRYLRGLGFVKLSGSYIYAYINGGSDNGAVITDAAGALQQHGVCLESTFNYPLIFRNQMPSSADAEAARFRVNQTVLCSSFDEIGTALQLGLIPQFPIQVGSNFQDFDSDGVAGYSRGPGNHSVHADGMKLSSSGAWILDMPNTWGASWGPTSEGRCFLSEQHIAGCADGSDAFVHVDPNVDPNSPLPTPK